MSGTRFIDTLPVIELDRDSGRAFSRKGIAAAYASYRGRSVTIIICGSKKDFAGFDATVKEWYENPKIAGYPKVLGIPPMNQLGLSIVIDGDIGSSMSLADAIRLFNENQTVNLVDEEGNERKDYAETISFLWLSLGDLLRIFVRTVGPEHLRKFCCEYVFPVGGRWVSLAPPAHMPYFKYTTGDYHMMEISESELSEISLRIRKLADRFEQVGIDDVSGLPLYGGRLSTSAAFSPGPFTVTALDEENVSVLRFNNLRAKGDHLDSLVRKIALEHPEGSHPVLGLHKPIPGSSLGLVIQGCLAGNLYNRLADYDRGAAVYEGLRGENPDEYAVKAALAFMEERFHMSHPFFTKFVLIFDDGSCDYLFPRYSLVEELYQMEEWLSHRGASERRGKVDKETSIWKIKQIFPELFSPQLIFLTRERGDTVVQFRASTPDELKKRKELVDLIGSRAIVPKGRRFQAVVGDHPRIDIEDEAQSSFHNLLVAYDNLDRDHITADEEMTIVTDFRKAVEEARGLFAENERFLPLLFLLYDEGKSLYLLDRGDKTISAAQMLLATSLKRPGNFGFATATTLKEIYLRYPELLV